MTSWIESIIESYVWVTYDIILHAYYNITITFKIITPDETVNSQQWGLRALVTINSHGSWCYNTIITIIVYHMT